MVNKKIWLGILVIVLVFGMAVIGCSGDDNSTKGSEPQTVNYEGADLAGNTYFLTVTEKADRAAYTPVSGDNYVLKIKKTGQSDKISRGTVKQASADGTFMLQPSVEGSATFSIVISNGEISSVEGNIAVDGGTFTPRSFNTIYLRANRYTNNGQTGEQWATSPILLSDFFTGTLKAGNKIRISGSVDKKLEHSKIDVMRIPSNGEWEWIGCAPGSTASQLVEISGSFDNSYALRIDSYDVLNKNDGEIIVMLSNCLWQESKTANFPDVYHFSTLPDDIPNGTIMATIHNFSISLIEE